MSTPCSGRHRHRVPGYVGGARRSIATRVARHCRLARAKSGRPHWHVDYLLVHPAVRLAAVIVYEQVAECALSRRLACRRGVSVAVPGFGASDCRSGCRTHLYRLAPEMTRNSATGSRARSLKYRITIPSHE